MARYTYGDSDLAAERLALVAATFEPSSRAFLERAAPPGSALAVDLGCGPGHTTRLVHAVVDAGATVGLDASAAHVERAAVDAPAGVTFAVHDATAMPLPTGPAGLIYARLLLAHLADHRMAVTAWATQLAPGGALLLDDLEEIDTDDRVFRAYLDEVALAVVRREGGALLVGRALHAMADPAGTARSHDDVSAFAPPAPVTARIFGMNLAVLTARREVEPRPDLAGALDEVAAGRRSAPAVTWRMRQVAFVRSG